MKTLNKTLVSLVVLPTLAASILGCDAAAPQDTVTDQAADARAQAYAAFRAKLTEVAPGKFQLADMQLDADQVDELFNRTHPAGNALIVRTYNGTRRLWSQASRWALTWCVSNDFGDDKAKVVEAMEQATAAWQTEAGAGVIFEHKDAEDASCTDSNRNVRIAVIYDSTLTGKYADSKVGPIVENDGFEHGRIRVAPPALSWWDLDLATFGSLDLKSVLAHETGHALGFFHEQSSQSSNGACSDDTWDSSTHEALTDYDRSSIMHYVWIQDTDCVPSTYQWISELDSEGVRTAYPGGGGASLTCQHRSYGRGAGTVPTDCGSGNENQAGLCYPKCRSGFGGAGPVCWQTCPSGFHDDGAFCRRDAEIISANTSSCPWYDVCGLTLAKGCSSCPSGYTNDGCTCRKDAYIFAKSTYTRGAGTVPTSCGSGQELDAGLCYPKCSAGFSGTGPVCWEQCN